MTTHLLGRVVTDGAITPARVELAGGRIASVQPDASAAAGPYLLPGFIDLHVHGWGGNDAMGGVEALGAMSRALLRRGVTAFLPTAVSAPLDELGRFSASVQRFTAPVDGAEALGANLEGPFLAPGRRGAHDPQHLLVPGEVRPTALEPLLDGLRLMTVAPELPGAVELIARLTQRGVVVSLGHSNATLDEARAGYAAGARSTTHLFNAMSGMAHRAPGLAAAALAEDAAAVELIADDQHVDPVFYRTVMRAKPAGRVLLVSDAITLAGTGDRRGWLGSLQIQVRDGRATLAGSDTLAGSLIALDDAVRNVVRAGVGLTDAAAAASTNPARLLGAVDRGRIGPGMRADIVELDDELRVVGVMRAGRRVAR